MGSKLAGGDIKVPPLETEKLAEEAKKWETSGKNIAAGIIKSILEQPKSRL
jgi:hypothetical protein